MDCLEVLKKKECDPPALVTAEAAVEKKSKKMYSIMVKKDPLSSSPGN
jgi:hypothetical protein